VGALLDVEAGIRQAKRLDRPAVEELFVDDLLDVLHADKTEPDRLRTDHDDRPVFALVEAAGLIGPDMVLQAGILNGVIRRRISTFYCPQAGNWGGAALSSRSLVKMKM
jgi:hypothetical protein